MFQYTIVGGNNLNELGKEIDRLAHEGWRVHTYHTTLEPTNLQQLTRVHYFLMEKEVKD